jgi:hypothetical protein
VGRLKEKHEAAVKLMHEHARAAVIANTRLAQVAPLTTKPLLIFVDHIESPIEF